MTRQEKYRAVFQAPWGHEVLADLASQVKQMPAAEAGSAGRLLAHIQLQLNQPDPPAKEPATRGTRASGGRIAHG